MIFIRKTQPAPPCLAIEKAKASGTYNCDGVLEQNRIDFMNKCYLCEDKEPHSINTEHFIPHRGDDDLKFDWNNLFFSCSHCNNTKLAKANYDLVLNRTVEGDSVDKNIRYHINPFPMEQAEFTPILANDIRVSNTIELLLAIYNGTTTLKKIESANLRSKLLKEIRTFQSLLFEFYDDNLIVDEKIEIRKKIVRHLRPTSNFTAFKRWVIQDNQKLSADFADCL